tara:strand:- start:961 stop:1404 length:444 start_codon:yes stop_codon:yes gene_type:complete
MKNILIFSIVLFTCCSFSAQNWITNLEKAKKDATMNNKYILIEFSGSDWCPPCKRLNEEVFLTEEWKTWSKDNLVCVLIDRPLKGLDSSDLKYNQKITELYDVKYFPTIIITDNEGNEVFRTGYIPGGVSVFINQLNKLARESSVIF